MSASADGRLRDVEDTVDTVTFYTSDGRGAFEGRRKDATCK
jgi:hypothetical protein